MKKVKYISLVLVFSLIIGGFFLVSAVKDDEEVSLWERRKLQQFPSVSSESLWSGDFIEDFAEYVSDQFPLRNELRRLKSRVHFYLYNQKDNGGIYIAENHASKIDKNINYGSVQNFTEKITSLYSDFLKDTDCNVYYSIIPDKNYFLAEKSGYPHLDYEELYSALEKEFSFMTEIEVKDLLSLEDYYTTDTHWKQENLIPVANRIRSAMGKGEVPPSEKKVLGNFYGVYYGQSALPLSPDSITCLINEETENCSVYNFETKERTSVYDEKKFSGLDSYDVFLSGAVSLLEITNPMGEEEKELVIFRDSFGSSLAPLILSSYGKITLIDTRYISPALLSDYVNFENQDVLFIYSTLLVNSSSTLK